MASGPIITGDRVRIGPITIITLVTVICLSVLAVLAISTAHATEVLAQRQADAVGQLYRYEEAGQTLVSQVDACLAPVRSTQGSAREGAQAIARGLDEACAATQDALGADADIDASLAGPALSAVITCGDSRSLLIEMTIFDAGTYRIDTWKTLAVQNEEQPMGNLFDGS